MSLSLNPAITLREVNRFVAARHRHHKPDRGCKFVTSVVANGNTVGVAVVGRPKSRSLQTNEPLTIEITRVCTDGTKNACSMLYGACRRAAFGIGFTRVITYTLPSEGGASLRGAGFVCKGEAGGGLMACSISAARTCPAVTNRGARGTNRGEAAVGGAS